MLIYLGIIGVRMDHVRTFGFRRVKKVKNHCFTDWRSIFEAHVSLDILDLDLLAFFSTFWFIVACSFGMHNRNGKKLRTLLKAKEAEKPHKMKNKQFFFEKFEVNNTF